MVDLLERKRFKSYKSLSRISEDILKKDFQKNISPGQYVLLQAGIEILQPPPPPPKEPAPRLIDQGELDSNTGKNQQQPPNATASPTSASAAAAAATMTSQPPGFPSQPPSQQLSASDLLAMWHQAGDLQPVTQLLQGNGPDDPFGFGTGPYASPKCRQVAEYITHMYSIDSDIDQDATVNIGGLEFSLAKGRKVPQEKVRFQHYMEGSLRILRELIVEESMPTVQIVNHVNYLIQIACLAQTNMWKKVKDYDIIYRREQHKHGFSWGKNSSFLLQSQLGTHDSTPFSQTTKKGPAAGQTNKRPPLPSVKNPNTGQTICNNFNGRNGCSWPNCNFLHVCKSCFSSAHSEIQHRESSSQSFATLPSKN